MTGKPRIAVIVPNLEIGGTERHLLAVLPRLRERGYEVSLLTTRGRGGLDDAFAAAGIAPRHPGRLAALGKAGVILDLALSLRRLRPAIVHFFLAEAYLLGGIAAALAGVRVRIMSRRSLNDYQARHPRLAALERRQHRRMRAVLGNSRAVCDELAAEGVPPARLGLIANGLDTAAFAPGDRAAARRALGLDADALVLVIVANLIAYKGHADLIDALACIADRLPAGWRLACVGRDSGLGAVLLDRAAGAGIGAHIMLSDATDDVRPWLHAADIALLASHEEGSPNSLIEAQAAGLPCVATEVGGVADIVAPGVGGLLVPPHSPERLGDAILALAGDPARRIAMGAAARDAAVRRFDIGGCVDAYAALYDAVAKRPDAPLPDAVALPRP